MAILVPTLPIVVEWGLLFVGCFYLAVILCMDTTLCEKDGKKGRFLR